MTKRKKRTRSNHSVVLIIFLLLATSAFLRLGNEAGQALAVETRSTISQETNDLGDRDAGGVTTEDGISNLLERLNDQEQSIISKSEELIAKERKLEIIQSEVNRRLENLETVETRLREMLSIANTAAEGDVSQLTSVYENMKPKDASKIFEEMEPFFAAGFLSRMRPASAAGVLSGLTPEKAYAISVILAGRNADIPSE